MGWWTTLEPEVRAAWIGVLGSLFGALLGAVVGGFWASRSARQASNDQWARESRARLEQAVRSLFVEILRYLNRLHWEKGLTREQRGSLVVDVGIVANLVTDSNPALYRGLRQISADMVSGDKDVEMEAVESLLNLSFNYIQDPAYGVSTLVSRDGLEKVRALLEAEDADDQPAT